MKSFFLISFVCSLADGRRGYFPYVNQIGKKPLVSTPYKPTLKPYQPTLKPFTLKPTLKPFTLKPSTPKRSISEKNKFALAVANKYATRKTRAKEHGRRRAMLKEVMTPEMLTALVAMITPMIIPLVVSKLEQNQLNQDKNVTVQTYATDQGPPQVCSDCHIEFENIWIAIDAKMQPFCEKYEELNFYDAQTQNCTKEGVENFFDKKTAEIFKDFGEENTKFLQAKSEYLIEMENNSKCSEEDDRMLHCITTTDITNKKQKSHAK